MTTKPKRIQMTRNKPWRVDNPDAVIVARPTKWGNPFKIGEAIPGIPNEAADAQDATDFFALFTAPLLPVEELQGKDLACWCPLDQPCHADVLLRLANRQSACQVKE